MSAFLAWLRRTKEEQRSASGGPAIVLEKWTRRQPKLFEVSPPAACDLRSLTSGIQMPKERGLVKACGSPKGRRLSGVELSQLPTPARRGARAPRLSRADARPLAKVPLGPIGLGADRCRRRRRRRRNS